jgi:hypothetical protein
MPSDAGSPTTELMLRITGSATHSPIIGICPASKIGHAADSRKARFAASFSGSSPVPERVDANSEPIPSPSIAPPQVESPVDAALRFLDLDEELFPPITPEKARALTESIASDASRSRLGQQAFDHQTQIIAKGDLGGLRLRIAPIVFRTRDCTTALCTVDVYFLRLWSFPDKGALDDFATVEIHAVYEYNQWRLNSSTLVDGPYPAGRFSARPTASLNAKAFETILNGYSDTETKR